MSVSSTSSSSTRKPGGTGKLRRSHFVPPCDSSVPLSSTLTVIDILYHCRDLARVLESAEPLDVIGTEIERAAFLELKMIFLRLELDDPARPPDQIDLVSHCSRENLLDLYLPGLLRIDNTCAFARSLFSNHGGKNTIILLIPHTEVK